MKNFDELEADFRKRYSRWSSGMWSVFVTQKVPILFERNSQLEAGLREKVIEAYLELCGEGIGVGRLFLNGQNVTQLLFFEKIPKQLSQCGDAKSQVDTLVNLWNLCEAIENQPAWVEPILTQRLASISKLSQVELIVDEFAKVLETSTGPNVGDISAEHLKLQVCETAHLGFFLPLRLEVVAPPVLAIDGKIPSGWSRVTVFAPDASIIAVENRASDPMVLLDKKNPIPPSLQKTLDFSLSKQDFTQNSLFAAAVFQESQNIWLWSQRGA